MPHTKTKDGYRWELMNSDCYSGIISARAQQRCTTDSGRTYYRYCGKRAQFDTCDARDRFLTQFAAKDWASGAADQEIG